MLRPPPGTTLTDTLVPYTTLFRSANRRRAVLLRGGRLSRPRAARARLAVGTRGVPVPGAVRLAVLRGVPRWQPAVRPDQRRVPGCRLHARLLRLLDALVHGLGDHRLPALHAARTPPRARNRAPADQAALAGASLVDLPDPVP